MRVSKTIGIEKFIEFWNNIKEGNFDAIVPDLGKEIKGLWAKEIMNRFMESKKGGSYGSLGDSNQLAQMMRNLQGPGARVPYNPDYAKRFPKTAVKTGDLRDKMQLELGLNVGGFDGDELMVRINIPAMDNEPFGPNIAWDWEYCYAHLEEWRSFIRSSLLLAWPKILKLILDKLADQ